ncbi:MAG: fuconate dehydratase [Planctomycetota bacterium]|nr:MAG: fuconate dehydratase [Planctomycetota bacterium]
MTKITEIEVRDIRFPTSKELDGSDAMNKAPDYSAAYVILKTDHPDNIEGYGLTFTIGRGNEICAKAIESLGPLIVGQDMDSIISDMRGFWRSMTGDSQLRWIGPEKGAIHLATAAIVNAVWDIYCKLEKKPLWRLLADMSPQELVSCVDFKYISDALTPQEALEILQKNESSKEERIKELLETGYPAYTTSVGWLGYDDEKLRHLCQKYLKLGWRHFKLKVGGNINEDINRCKIFREEIGDDCTLRIDANQVWDVEEAIAYTKRLAEFKPLWIEEPTSPDDILGHATIAKALNPLGIGVATGEHCHNRVMFKQFLQAGAMQFCQIDSCRLGGVNEVLAVLLMAKKFDVPVCPHAGGVGLCEYVQHLSIFDYIGVSASLENRRVEFANPLSQHIVNPAVLKDGNYLLPEAPGYGAEFNSNVINQFEFPNGSEWVNS